LWIPVRGGSRLSKKRTMADLVIENHEVEN
jgi:hypothetical protein